MNHSNWVIVVILSVLVAISSFDFTFTNTTTDQSKSYQIKGIAVENISGIDHLIERYFGPPGLFSLDEQIKQLGLVIHSQDQVLVIPAPEFGIGSLIEIRRATEIKIIDAGVEQAYHTWSTTVESLLNEHNIVLGDKDKIEPKLNTDLFDKLTINIIRVSVGEVKRTETIDYQIITQEDKGLEQGKKIIKQKGQRGLKTKFYEVVRENGQEVSRKFSKEEITKPPQEEIVVVGTKVVVLGEGEATWYRWREGGAAHNTLPKGTKVKVINLANNKSTIVTINDRGIMGSAIIDLDHRSFAEIAPLGKGRIIVRLEKFSE